MATDEMGSSESSRSNASAVALVVSGLAARRVGCLAGLLLCSLVQASDVRSISQRVANRDFPSVFQAWNRADNLPGEDPTDTAARHDLMWHVAGGYRLQWNAPYEGLGESFTPQSMANGRSYRQNLLSRNPNMVLLVEVRYRDAPSNYLPIDSPWWMRDAAGHRKPGWEEGGFYLLNYPDPGFQAHADAENLRERLIGLNGFLTQCGERSGKK